MNVVSKTKLYFLETFKESENPPYKHLPRHVFETEKWTQKILPKYPEADRETVLLAVWLHDIGQVVGQEKDHAMNSANEVRQFLPKLKISPTEIGNVAHCVRAHKCKDILPETIEAKVLAVANSVSHMTDFYYITMTNRISKKKAVEKLEGDCESIDFLPKMKEEVKPFCKAWRELLKIYPA